MAKPETIAMPVILAHISGDWVAFDAAEYICIVSGILIVLIYTCINTHKRDSTHVHVSKLVRRFIVVSYSCIPWQWEDDRSDTIAQHTIAVEYYNRAMYSRVAYNRAAYKH